MKLLEMLFVRWLSATPFPITQLYENRASTLLPIAIAPVPDAVACEPIAADHQPCAFAFKPIAVAYLPAALQSFPFAKEA
ncbi:MAG: hypothetical protein U9N85_04840 [Bacteroidota bacterium]|nr:hypothetical protein [Bacteroidota bacterium]